VGAARHRRQPRVAPGTIQERPSFNLIPVRTFPNASPTGDDMTLSTTQAPDVCDQAPTTSAPSSDPVASLTGIERVMADALIALDGAPPGPPVDPGPIEYASWLRLLRRSRP
jgi:hypothetical protein